MPTYFPVFGTGTNSVTGVTAVVGYGQRQRLDFLTNDASSPASSNWTVGDTWRWDLSTTSGRFTLGAGNLVTALLAYVNDNTQTISLFTFKDRVYLGVGQEFYFSDNGDPLGWEQQNPGAGFVEFLSQVGSQDQIVALSQLQGRLAVFGKRSIQLWVADADPANFAIQQNLDNVGTVAPQSVQQLGDLDVLFLDSTGIRSLRALQMTLNAYIDDIGSAIDNLLQADLLAVGTAGVCSVVEPSTRNYWLYINGTIYVLSRHPSSKVTAWSTYKPTDDSGATFVPEKFVVLDGRVYCRSTAGNLYLYGGAAGGQYDAHTVVDLISPYLDAKTPSTNKTATGISFVQAGKWSLKVSTNPADGTPQTVIANQGDPAVPDSTKDSSYDLGRFPVDLQGTHFCFRATSANRSTTKPAVFSALVYTFNMSEK